MQRRILVIEDEATVRASIAHVLRAFGSVDQAGDGLAGLHAFRQALIGHSPYHLVTIDLQLPQMDGQMLLECMRGLEMVRGDGPKAKCVMLTGETSRGVILDALRTGADSYMCKPFQLEDLRSRVLEMLGLPTPPSTAPSPAKRPVEP
jgi:two-component system chemotaxis response regulator CheY